MPALAIYRLRISLSDDRGRPGEVWRTVEIPASATLKRLHELIFDLFDREDDHHWSFFFGKPGKRSTAEYTCSAGRDDAYSPNAKSGSSVRLSSLPFQTTREIHYLFDFGDEWWHRIEFLGEAAAEPKTTYPRLIGHQGASPPQYDDEPLEMIDLSALDSKGTTGLLFDEIVVITFEELVQTLNTCQSPLSADEVIGLMMGVLASPYPVGPSRYLPIVLGERSLSGIAEANRVISSLMNLHNQIASAIMARTLFTMRGWHPETVDGLSAQIKALRGRILWFMRGLDVGGAGSDELIESWGFNFEALAKMDNMLEGIEDLVRRKRRSAKDRAELIGFQPQIVQLSAVADQAMMTITLTARGFAQEE